MNDEQIAELRELLAKATRQFYQCSGISVSQWIEERANSRREVLKALPALLDAYEARGRALEWQPIETAPKDGAILLYWPDYRYDAAMPEGDAIIVVGSWKFNRRIDMGYFSDNGESDDYGLVEHAPTHWMPLPLPPAPTEQAPE